MTENTNLQLAQKFGKEFLEERLIDEKKMLSYWEKEFDNAPRDDTPESDELIDSCIVEKSRWKRAILLTSTLIEELEKAEQDNL